MSMVFSKNAMDALNAASSCASQFGHDHIGSEHVFMAILAMPKCGASQRLVRLGLSLDELTESIKGMIAVNAEPVMQRGPLPVTARTKKVVEMAGVEATRSRR